MKKKVIDYRLDIYDSHKSFISKRLAIIIVIVSISLTVLLTIYSYLKRPEPMKSVPSVATESLYIFAPKDGVKLVQNVSEVKADISERQKADEIMNELKRQKCVPEKLTLYDFAAGEDGVMYLNFSKELMDDKSAGTSREITMTYAIVNTFISNFRNINKIQLLVEGHPTETINGLVYIYKPIEFKTDLMED
jgi:spore germination protein GerM